MRVLDISTTNLHIMQGIAQDYSKLSSLPANIDSILSRVIIRYELDYVNPFELIALLKIGCVNSIIPDSLESINLKDFLDMTRFTPENTEDEILLQKVISTNSIMEKHNVYEYNFVRKVGPIGIQQYQCNVVLKGSSILNLYGYKFGEIFEIPENESMNLESFIEAKLITGLMNATYSVLQDKLISKDIYTNAWCYENLYRGRTKAYTLMSIFDNLGNTINFVDTTPDILKDSIENAKKMNGSFLNREWTIELVCDTPLYMYFFYLFTNLEKDRRFNIVDTEDMMIVLGKERRSFDILQNVNVTDDLLELVKKSVVSYDAWFDDNMNHEKFDLFSRFLFAPANAKIRYTMHLKWYPEISSDYQKILLDTYNYPIEASEELECLNILRQVDLLIHKNDLNE